MSIPSKDEIPRATEVIAAPIIGDQEAGLPRATAMVPQHFELTTTEVRSIAREEIELALEKYQKKSNDRFSSFQVAMMKDVSKSVSNDVAKMLQDYSKKDLPNIINSRINVLFPRFIADNTVVKKYFNDHLRSIDDMFSSRKKEITFELETVAKSVADKMSHHDTFGYIYESVANSANKRITEESNRVQAEQFKRLEKELELTRQQRDSAMKDFVQLNTRMKGYLHEQKKFTVVALCGFCMGMISLTSVVLSNSLWKN